MALHLLLLAFIRDFGHQFQRPTHEDTDWTAKKFENRQVPENMLAWLPKLGLNQEGSMSEVVGNALAAVARPD